MDDHITLLKQRLEKSQARRLRARKALESAESEISDINTTLRILGEISGDSPNSVRMPASASTSGRQNDIAGILSETRENAKSPSELFQSYTLISEDDINIDTFRTTIWRMKENKYVDVRSGVRYVVQSESGKYWKEPLSPNDSISIQDNSGDPNDIF